MKEETNRSIYMAFLGTGSYVTCHYGSFNDPVVRYVQTASLRKVEENGKVAHAIILCTKGAKEKHWDGVQAECVEHGLTEPECVDIDDALDPNGMWSVFRTVVDKVPKGAKLYFDATHSFRSLSIIMTVMLNYLKVVKQVEVEACYYGAWEAATNTKGEHFPTHDTRGKSSEEKDSLGAGFCAPLVDLCPFLELNDWTTVLGNFLDYGDAGGLMKMAKGPLGKLISRQPVEQRDDHPASAARRAINAIDAYCRKVRLANLGLRDNTSSLVGGDDCGSAVRNLKVVCADGDSLLPQLQPLLRELQNRFTELDVQDETARGLNAAEWAAQHDMIPQAYTLLQETIVSWVVARVPTSSIDVGDVSGQSLREMVSCVLAWMGGKRKKGEGGEGEDEDWREENGSRATAESIKALVPQQLISTYMSIKARRNALNHAGTNDKEPIKFKQSEYTEKGVSELIECVRENLCEL